MVTKKITQRYVNVRENVTLGKVRNSPIYVKNNQLF